jgi:toxin YoeB
MYMKGALSGFWSRRISEAHRMVYRATSGDLQIAQLGYHD